MRVLFLDFDGVIVTAHDRFTAGDQFAVFNLNRITDATGANLVVSSSWRSGYSLEALKELLKKWGVTGEVIGVTPDHTVSTTRGLYVATERGHEIQAWLDAHPEVSEFIILDDDADMAHLRHRWVKTHAHHGLDEHQTDKAIAMFDGSQPPTPTEQTSK
jgi:hypothetical protein